MIRNYIVFTIPLLLFSLAVPAFSQQFQNKAEYDAYMALYNEQDSTLKVQLGEDFISLYPESEAAPIAYQLLVATHYANRDWRSIVDVAKRFDRNFPNTAAETKSFIYTRAMAAAQQEQSPLDIIDFGDKILGLDRNNLGALLTLPPVILDNLPEFGSARESNLARVFELANRARIRAQEAYPIVTTDTQQAMQRIQVFSRIYLYLGQVQELRGNDQRAVIEYGRILEYDSRNSDAYLRIGLAYQRQAAAESGLLQQALANARETTEDTDAETPVSQDTDNLDPVTVALEQGVLQNLDLAIDHLAGAVAMGGLAADLAQVELERLYTMRNEDSLEGLDDLIAEKRTDLTPTQ